MLLYPISILVLVCGALVSLADFRNRLCWPGPLFSLAGTLCAAMACIQGLIWGSLPEIIIPWHLPYLVFHLDFDSLTLFFALIAALVCLLAALYGWDYLKHNPTHKGQNRYWFFYNLLTASLLLLLAARNGMLFLISWEMMSLSSFFLVIQEYEKKQVVKAGQSYLIATHLGTAFLLLLFLILDKGGQMEFSGFLLSPGAAGPAFLFALVGFGTKAGIVPLHTWLPEAHPAAPAPVSTVMSAIMLKMGIYGILRFLTLVPGIPLWWGSVLLILGVLSALTGAVAGLFQQDIKKFLAYCSVENIGIILIGIGLGVIGRTTGSNTLTFLGFSGALLHVFNHALAKSTLFFGAGAVLQGSGLRSTERAGGLNRSMPWTSFSFLCSGLSVCGLPPVNGFVGEFLLYLGALRVAGPGNWTLLAICGLALSGALAAFNFCRIYGTTFLGSPRTPQAAQAREVSRKMRIAMLIPALACLFIGFSAPLWLTLILPVVQVFCPFPVAELAPEYSTLLGYISISGLLLCLLFLLITGLGKWLQAGRKIQKGPTWDCGYHATNPRMQYTASSFAEPLTRFLRKSSPGKKELRLDSDLFPRKGFLSRETPNLMARYIIQPLSRSFRRLSARLFWLRKGNTHLFVLYIALTTIILLIWKLR